MRRVILPVALVLSCMAGVAQAEAGKALEGAERTWTLYCKGCHEAGTAEHPATLRLHYTRGPEKASIKGRKDLTPEYLKEVVRKGYLEMVGFRQTEITDAQLDELIRFIREE